MKMKYLSFKIEFSRFGIYRKLNWDLCLVSSWRLDGDQHL